MEHFDNDFSFKTFPGVINTELGRHLNAWYMKCFRPLFEFVIKTPFYGAQTTLYCTLDDAIECESGMYYSDCAKKNPASQALNKEDQVSILEKLFSSPLTKR
jgi:retinol dehydrogenase-12